MTSKQMKILRNIIMVVTVVLGFLCWLAMPYEFKNSSLFHAGNGEYGNKMVALILLLFPLFSLIPDKSDSEVHTDDPVERAKILEEYSKKDAKRQLDTAIGIGLAVVGVMGVAALVL